MRNFTYYLSIAVITILISACSKSIQRVSISQDEQWKPRGKMFFVSPEGRYKGAVPCANCPGIEVTLDFKDDNSVVKNMRFIQSESRNKKEKGTWVVTEGNIVKVSFGASTTPEYYKAQNGGHLVMLDDKKELNIRPEQAQFFIFNKD